MISIIEGVGDEVVYFLGLAVVIMVLVLAWSSTSVTDHGLIRTAVLVIERPRIYIASLDRQRRAFVGNSTNTTTLPVPSPPDGPTASTNQLPSQSVTTNESGAASTSEPSSSNVDHSGDPDSPPRGGSGGGEEPVVAPKIGVDTDANVGVAEQSDKCDGSGIRLRERSVPDGAADSPASGDEKVVSSASGTSDASRVVAAAEVAGCSPTPAVVDGNIRVRLKFLNDTQKLVEAQLADRLGNFKRQHFGEELGNNRVVRLIFNGQLLQRDQESLQFHGLHDNCVVHCHVSSAAVSPPAGQGANQSGQPQQHLQHHHHHAYGPPLMDGGPGAYVNGTAQAELDMGRLMLPLFGLILGLIWCCRLQYRQYFNATSTLALLCITGLFVVSVLAVCMPERRRAPPPAAARAH